MKIIEKVIQSDIQPNRQDVVWIDTSDPSNPITKIYVNGQWVQSSDESEQIDRLQREVNQLESDLFVDPEAENKKIKESLLPETRRIIEITWAELKELRDNSELIIGMQYRIIDYNTTTVQYDTQSAGHQFDIIVVADDDHTLNENARAARCAEDIYFTDAKLEAWELKYCLDNDATRFDWADAGSTGKGVIYYMKDEWGNECPYDFKNIQFKVGNKVEPGTIADVFYYTFSVATGTGDSTVTDHSLNGAYCHNNKMGVRVSLLKQTLPFNVFRNTTAIATCNSNIFGNNCSYNTFGNTCSFNTFGSNCSSNTFGNVYESNTFGYNCHSNTFGDGCNCNTFGDGCYSNTFGKYCVSNTLGNFCSSNSFGKNCEYNTLEYESDHIALGNNCIYNTFGNNCTENQLLISCEYNTFGCECKHIMLGSYCNNNTFGGYVQFFIAGNVSGATSIGQTINYVRYLIVENGVQNVNAYCTGATSDSNYCQNIKIGLGVKGSAADNRLQINITSQIGATANVTYEPTGSSVINV